jgi:hypothetical protein
MIWNNNIPHPGFDRMLLHRFKQPVDRLRVRNVSRNVVEACINSDAAAATSTNSAHAASVQRLPASLIYFSVASMALWMWLLHPSVSFLAINCSA